MKLAAIAKLIKADGYCKLYKVFYDESAGWHFAGQRKGRQGKFICTQ